ncbi:MAG: hypothetical protein AMJ81_01045 [Phycisphaerae bacterium SM23_33]|nr:MAG: hypothetical protein AMJ81_01045 [Phycisphaerae bacterium SM23_33]
MLWLGAATAPAAPATQPTAEAKLVKDLYGRRIAEAMASADVQDNIELAWELMTAAAESGNPPLVRHLLAVEAVRLTASLGTADGASVAEQALKMADQLGALDPVRKHRLALEIARQRYTTAHRAGAARKLIAPMVSAVVNAEISLAEALLDKHELAEAESVLSDARAMVNAYRLAEHKDRLDAATRQAKTVRERSLRIRRAEGSLARAREAGDEEGIKAAKKELAFIYLLTDGDIAEAGSWLAGSGHPDEAAVAAAAAHRKDPKAIPPADKCNDIVEKLCDLAQQAETGKAGRCIASAAAGICRDSLGTQAKGPAATKARLLLTRAERLAGESPADLFVGRLKMAYGGLAGKLEVLPGGCVRVSYDFSDDSQLGDWSVQEGPWKVAASMQALLAGPQRPGRAQIASRLHFRADKPLTLRYLVSGQQQLGGTICFLRHNDPAFRAYEVRFELGSYNNRGSSLRDGGRQVWNSPRVRVARGSTYRVEAAWDGQSTFTWTVNDQLLCRQETPHAAREPQYTSVYVGLEAGDYPAGFDDVVIEGVVIERPSQRLEPAGTSR